MPDYHHNPAYSAGSSKTYSNGYASNAASADHRRPPATASSQRQSQQHQQQQPQQHHQHQPSQSHSHHSFASHDAGAPSSSSGSARKRGREEPVDWERYFGGKPPKEIIVIDDDDSTSATTAQSTVPPAMSGSSHSAGHPLHHSSNVNNGSSSYHTDKRRKMATTTATATTTAYDPVYNTSHQHSYSNTQTPYYEPSPRTYTGSTDRTASYNTTAPTSLSSNGTYLEEGRVGEKRKRTTRQAAADQKKREVATRPDPYSEYIPPPKPPLKAKDVYVPVVHDVKFLHSMSSSYDSCTDSFQRVASRNDKVDDEDGHYLVVDGTDLTERYSIVRLLGQGTFGKVVQAWDRKRQSEVAVKIIRSVQKYRDASRIELRVLSTLSQNDKQNRNKCIHLRDTFDFRNHICIVTDLLGQSVFDFLKSNQFVPFPSSHIQKFARQLFTSVACKYTTHTFANA